MAEIQLLKERDRQLPAQMPTSIQPNPNLQFKKKKGNTRKRAPTAAEAVEPQESVIQARIRAQGRVQAVEKQILAWEQVAKFTMITRWQARRHNEADIAEDQ